MTYPGAKRSFEVTLSGDLHLLVRPATREDKPLFAQGIKEMSGTARYLRFFSGFREAPETVLDRLIEIDGHRHIAWCAIENGSEPIHPVAAVHAIRDPQDPDVAEIAVAVVDQFQRRGISKMLMALVMRDCIDAGYALCAAHILSENTASLRLFKTLGSQRISADGPDNLYILDPHVALETLRLQDLPKTIADWL